MEKLKMHSPDLTQDNIARLRELFPDCVTEAAGEDGSVRLAVDFDQLRQALSESLVEGPQERYRLDWPGKREALLTANAPIAKTLRPCREESVDFDTTQNLFIEGDNLDALKLLQETYLGKVKLIYIDPPYNTGRDFIYDDDFAEGTESYKQRTGQRDEEDNRLVQNTPSNGRFHSDWLSMIYARLRLARNLLKDDGVLFISIDDGEAANLREICDQVFGNDNFIGNVVWQKKYTRSNDAKWFSDNHDHILCYAKCKEDVHLNLLPRSDEQKAAYSNPDNHPHGSWKATPLHAKSGTNTSSYTFRNGVVWSPPTGTYRRFNDDTMKKLDDGDEIWFGADGHQTPCRKSFLSEVKSGVTPVTIWPYDEVGHNHEANNELKQLGMGGLFSNPKPTRLIKRELILATSPDSLILDFFSGSSTTAHAVMALNSEDNGNRRFIMVQLPEPCDQKSEAYKVGFPTIAEISKERIRRAGARLKSELGKVKSEIKDQSKSSSSPALHSSQFTTHSSLDTGFRVLKIDTSNMADVYYTPDAVTQTDLLDAVDNIKPDRTAFDLLFQVMLDWGVDLALPIEKKTIQGKEVYFVDDNALAACFDADGGIDDAFAKELATHKPLRAVFRDAGFKDSTVKINIEQVFKLLSPITEVKCL